MVVLIEKKDIIFLLYNLVLNIMFLNLFMGNICNRLFISYYFLLKLVVGFYGIVVNYLVVWFLVNYLKFFSI